MMPPLNKGCPEMVQDLRWCLWAGREDSSARGWRGQAQRSMCKPGEKEEVRSTGAGEGARKERVTIGRLLWGAGHPHGRVTGAF